MNENFSSRDIADYYNQTQNHYQKWWDLNNSKAVHYGIWDESTSNFAEALVNTNKMMAGLAGVKKGFRVLDAGCGVGGSSLFLANKYQCKTSGITLSEKQYETALINLKNSKLESLVDFSLQDYTNTNFKDETFDLIFCCESITSAPDKIAFSKEAQRILKPGGKIVIADYFRTKNPNNLKTDFMEKWRLTWSMAKIETFEEYMPKFLSQGFKLINDKDFTNEIKPTAKRMYYSSILGTIPSVLYNITHPKVSRFGKIHYKSGYYQYKALMYRLWEYHIVVFEKK